MRTCIPHVCGTCAWHAQVRNPHILTAITRHGGHMGYTAGLSPLAHTWTDRLLVHFLRHFDHKRAAAAEQSAPAAHAATAGAAAAAPAAAGSSSSSDAEEGAGAGRGAPTREWEPWDEATRPPLPRLPPVAVPSRL